MRHAQGQSGLHQRGGVLFVRQREINFPLHFARAAQRVRRHGFLEDAVTVRRIVEVRDGFVQGVRREIRQHALERAKARAALGEIGFALRAV